MEHLFGTFVRNICSMIECQRVGDIECYSNTPYVCLALCDGVCRCECHLPCHYVC